MFMYVIHFAYSFLFSRSPMPAQRNFSAQLQLKVQTFFVSLSLSVILKCCHYDGTGVLPFPWCHYHNEIGMHCPSEAVVKFYTTARLHHMHKADVISSRHTGFSARQGELKSFISARTPSAVQCEN